MVDSMENSKPINEQHNESEKLSTDTTIGSCSELLPVFDGKTLLIKNTSDAENFAAMKEILQLLRTIYDDETPKQIKEKIESGEISTQWYDTVRPPFPGECKTDTRMVFSEPPILPPSINPKDFIKGWTDE
jgi:hypothetical protein